VKICGITNEADAISSVEAGADAIGLNFFRASPRFVDSSRARDVVAALPPNVKKVGVFVNAELGEILRTFDELLLDAIQLHGDEPPEFMVQLGSRPIIRAFRVHRDGLQSIRDYLDLCQTLDCPPSMVLVDSLRPGHFGGTGITTDWESATQLRAMVGGVPLALAGGLTPRNVAEAVRRVQPDAVDTASGVESKPGIKDVVRLREFVAEATKAFSEL
jgi:phosphoribosylanthranilate isomerase